MGIFRQSRYVRKSFQLPGKPPRTEGLRPRTDGISFQIPRILNNSEKIRKFQEFHSLYSRRRGRVLSGPMAQGSESSIRPADHGQVDGGEARRRTDVSWEGGHVLGSPASH